MISIIIVSFNSRSYIADCLNSVWGQSFSEYEVIVVDNGSKDGTMDFLKLNSHRLRLIAHDQNRGVCIARNVAIALARGEWVLTLDSDVVLERDFLSRFHSLQIDLSVGIGMVQPNIFFADGATIYSNGIVLSLWRRFFDASRGRRNGPDTAALRKIIGPCAAAAFYRRALLEQVRDSAGYFDERFFFLVEDVDLAWRAKLHGWRVAFLQELTCRHLGNGSASSEQWRQYLSFRNRYLMINKNEKAFVRILIYLISAPYEVVRLIYVVLTNKYFWLKNPMGRCQAWGIF